MNDESADRTAQPARVQFRAGMDDVVILPLVLVGLGANALLRTMFSLVIQILDYAFPIVVQLIRFPLFTVRILGDGLAALLLEILRRLPVPSTRRETWRAFVERHWSWMRRWITYKAFQDAVHRAFEGGMVRVFRRCATLTPGGALLVIAGAILWFPVSFAIATGIHAVLIAKAASLPAWMQFLHPVATLIAKSKLLVLPVYPAAWPQAKRHPLTEGALQFYRDVTSLPIIRKFRYRYLEADCFAVGLIRASTCTTVFVTLRRRCGARCVGDLCTLRWFDAFRTLAAQMVKELRRLPFVGATIRRYAAHYPAADEQRVEKLSGRIRQLFERWAVKLSAEYYIRKTDEKLAAAPR